MWPRPRRCDKPTVHRRDGVCRVWRGVHGGQRYWGFSRSERRARVISRFHFHQTARRLRDTARRGDRRHGDWHRRDDDAELRSRLCRAWDVFLPALRRAEAESSLLLPRRVDMAKAAEFLLLGQAFGAEEAGRLGLAKATRFCDREGRAARDNTPRGDCHHTAPHARRWARNSGEDRGRSAADFRRHAI
jgi:hypothetical protein